MKKQVKLFSVFALMGAAVLAQDWNAIQAKLAGADAKAVVNMLSSKDVYEREAALAQIARDDARPALTRAAADALAALKSTEIRVQLIAVLAERNDPAAAPAVRKALGDADSDVRTAAVIACGLMRDDKAADALLEMYRKAPASEEIREALRRIPSPSIDRALVKTLGTKVYTHRAAVLDLLAARRYAGVLGLAMDPKLFDGTDMALTKSAAAVIRTYAPEGGFRPLLDFARKLSPSAADLLLGTLTTTLNESKEKVANEQYIVKLLQSCPPDFVPVLTALLGASQGPIALSVLSKRLEAGDVETRKDAARNLGKWTNEDALPVLAFVGKSDRDLGVQNLAWRMLVDVAKREEKMGISNRAVAALEQVIWFAPRRAERSAAIDALKLYAKKNGGVRPLLERVAAERLDLADDVQQVKDELNWK
ncbi:MAG: HEAT repeat domain-containing protein [Kiritimatiellaeota bacterium]|nr:HEAT repeat domain-containing protein [Kiritimatiellota bacterium]